MFSKPQGKVDHRNWRQLSPYHFAEEGYPKQIGSEKRMGSKEGVWVIVI